MPAYRKRHDAVLELLKADMIKLILKPKGGTLRVDRAPDRAVSESTLRPDLIYITTDGEAWIIDAKCPYPSMGFVERTHERNVTKYQGILDQHVGAGHAPGQVLTFIVPSAGSNPLHSYDSLLLVGFSPKQATNLLSRVSGEVAKQNERLLRRTLRKDPSPPPPPLPTAPGADEVEGEPPDPEPEVDPLHPPHGVELDPADFPRSFPQIIDDLSQDLQALSLSSPQAQAEADLATPHTTS
jgi:hypothetical protein